MYNSSLKENIKFSPKKYDKYILPLTFTFFLMAFDMIDMGMTLLKPFFK